MASAGHCVEKGREGKSTETKGQYLNTQYRDNGKYQSSTEREVGAMERKTLPT